VISVTEANSGIEDKRSIQLRFDQRTAFSALAEKEGAGRITGDRARKLINIS